MGESAYKALVGRPEGKILLGRHRHNGRILLKWFLKEIRW
jgi:hypothetical protein